MINADLKGLLIEKSNLLSEDEKIFLSSIIENFKPETTPGTSENYYFRQFIEGEEMLASIEKFLGKISNTLTHDFFYPHAKLEGMWVNRVDNTSNQNDNFHRDINKFSSVTFLNDDFTGGNFEYWDIISNESRLITPKYLDTVIFEGSRIPHRVQPVTEGVRYTLVSFWNLESKTFTTLL